MAGGDEDGFEEGRDDENIGTNGQGAGQQDEPEGDEGELPAEQLAGEEDDGEQEVVDEPPQRRRANDTIRELRLRAQQAEREKQEFQSRLRELEMRSTQHLTAQQEAERLALMTPEERSDYKLNKALETQRAEIQRMTFQQADTSDRLAFETKAASNPVYARYQEEVETRLMNMRAQGQNVPREELLKWVLGDRALRAAPKDRAKAQRSGQQRIARQQTPPTNARGDHGSRRERQGDSLEARLKDVYI